MPQPDTVDVVIRVASAIDSKTLVPDGFTGIDSYALSLLTAGDMVASASTDGSELLLRGIAPVMYTAVLEGLSGYSVVTRDTSSVTVDGSPITLTARTPLSGTGAIALTIVGSVPKDLYVGGLPITARLLRGESVVLENALPWATDESGNLSVAWIADGIEAGVYDVALSFGSVEGYGIVTVTAGETATGTVELNAESAERVATPVISVVEEKNIICNNYFIYTVPKAGTTPYLL